MLDAYVCWLAPYLLWCTLAMMYMHATLVHSQTSVHVCSTDDSGWTETSKSQLPVPGLCGIHRISLLWYMDYWWHQRAHDVQWSRWWIRQTVIVRLGRWPILSIQHRCDPTLLWKLYFILTPRRPSLWYVNRMSSRCWVENWVAHYMVIYCHNFYLTHFS